MIWNQYISFMILTAAFCVKPEGYQIRSNMTWSFINLANSYLRRHAPAQPYNINGFCLFPVISMHNNNPRLIFLTSSIVGSLGGNIQFHFVETHLCNTSRVIMVTILCPANCFHYRVNLAIHVVQWYYRVSKRKIFLFVEGVST